MTPHKETHISEPRINDRIRVPEVRLVGPNGEQVGIVRVEDALRLAQEADLDLVEVAPQAKPPVCKLMDFGKYKYEAAIKEREARKNQSNTVLKTVRLRLKIDPHDYATKKGMAVRFLETGDKVKVMIMFRGREQSRPEMGYRLLQRFATDVAELGAIESSPQQDGRNMVMVIGPLKRKADMKSEQKRRREPDEALLDPAPLPETVASVPGPAVEAAPAPDRAAPAAVQQAPAAAPAEPAPAPAETSREAPAPTVPAAPTRQAPAASPPPVRPAQTGPAPARSAPAAPAPARPAPAATPRAAPAATPRPTPGQAAPAPVVPAPARPVPARPGPTPTRPRSVDPARST